MFSRAFWRKFLWATGYEAINPFEKLTREIIQLTRKKITTRIIKYAVVVNPIGAFKIEAYSQGKYENNTEAVAVLELKAGESNITLSYWDYEMSPVTNISSEFSLSNPEFLTVVAHEFSVALSRKWKFKEVKFDKVH